MMFSLGRTKRIRARQALLPFCVPETMITAEKLPSPVYWEKWASNQGVAVILYRNLKSLLHVIPVETRERMKITLLESIFWDQCHKKAICQIVESLRLTGLDAIFLKGVSLSNRYYPESYLRPSGDIDILIHKSDIDEFKRLLFSLGYKLIKPDLENFFRNEKGELQFFSEETSILVETHWYLVNSKALRKNLFVSDKSPWDETETIWIGEVPIKVLLSRYLFVYLCVHLAQHHQMSRLIWFIDLLQIMKHDPEIFRDVDLWKQYLKSNGARLAVAACVRFLSKMFPETHNIPEIKRLFAARFLPKIFFNVLGPAVILYPESSGMKYRKKIFREALKLRA